MSDSGPSWTALCDLDDLAPGEMKAVGGEGHKLVVIRGVDERVRVLDNRCPHEGYPLSQGQLDGTTLSCCWHNWKFNVDDGGCVLGGESAKTWPCRVWNGAVQADLAAPDPATVIPGLLVSLREGLFEHDSGRAVRDGIRLLQLGMSPRGLLRELAIYDAEHGEYGSTHVLALAADCARGLADDLGPEAMYAIAPVIDLCGETHRRLPLRERGAALAHDVSTLGPALRAAVEAEDLPLAQGLLAGAFEAGAQWSQAQRWLLEIASEHFTDFGHQLIYLTKAGGVLEGAENNDAERELALGLLDSLLFATREDTLPYMGRYSRRLQAIEDDLPMLFAGVQAESLFDGKILRQAVLDGSATEALDALEESLRAGVSPQRIALELVAAGAHRLLRFDVSLDGDRSCAEGWLWASHRFTFAAAVRQAVELLPSPEVLRFLYQAVAFLHSGKPMDVAPGERLDAAALQQLAVTQQASTEDDLKALDAALAAKHAGAAVTAAQGLLITESGVVALRAALESLCLSDPLVRPIVVAHGIKTTWAAFEERQALGDHSERDVPVLAAVRMLSSPIIERRIHELVERSIDWVVHGKMPRKLTQ
ncbi:MAG: nitrite reductase/ring-hydroxylating ferredoxin subunit [Pseudohongiellaceae bacterium]|jgi:nitrite reductase/ring-hydroxylating ferredoxin subunit